MAYLFSSESVSEGHPDKLCDQISDAILDAALAQDPDSRVAAECFASTGLIVVGGEITTKAHLDIRKIVRQTIQEIGYTDPAFGIDAESCGIITTINQQSPDIAQGVNEKDGELGAGDQGMMFGFACNQTPELMPLPISLAHRLVRKLAELRKSKKIAYLRPDAKAQITVEFDEAHQPKRIHTVVISTQHNPDVSQDQIKKDMIEQVINAVIPEKLLDSNTRIFINPTGKFVIGGPHGDTGLTGRKIIVDTYGGWSAHGGGAFSGKDATKVDRSGAYIARYIAKNLVAAGIADQVEIQLAYAIGVAQPVSIHVNTRGTSSLSNQKIEALIAAHFELTPSGIIKTLDLNRPIYRNTAAYGHFGRDDLNVPWEKTDKVEALKKALQAVVV